MIIVSLDLILTILAVCFFLGAGWAVMIGSWLWSHAIAVGIFLLVIHVVFSFCNIVAVATDYKLPGIISAAIHAAFPPIIVISAYRMCIASGKSFGGSLFINWLLIFFCISAIECLWNKATETRGGLSYFRLVVFTIFGRAASLFVTNLILREGF